VTAFIAGHAPTHVIVLNPRAGALGRPVEATADVTELALLWDDSPPQPRQLNRSYSGRGGLRTRHWITNDVLRVASI